VPTRKQIKDKCLLAVGARLKWAALPLPEALAWVGGIGFGLYLLARLAERCATHPEGASHIRNSLAVWPEPLTRAGMFLSGLAVVATLPFVLSHTTAAAAALASAGALHLAIAYQGRYYRLGYIGMAMLQVAWALALIMQDVSQPQWYAVPAGLYFTAVGSLERRRKRGRFAAIVESFGLAVLLVTSFVQSLDGADGFPYFVLLLAEGLLVMWWGAAQRRKIPLFAGLAASALNVVAQAVVLVSVYEVNRWFIILGAGLLLVVVGVFVERQRERVIARAQEWRETLEMWE
ncbi:MAG: SCO7613 C-terminal domain-containing membrane protein, partial [Anaerolineales bacterium]